MKRSLLVQFMGTAVIAFVAGIAVGGYLIPTQLGSQFGGYQIHPRISPTTTESLKTTRVVAETYTVPARIPRFVAEHVPQAQGCYVDEGKMVKVDCLRQEDITKYPPPAPCTGPDGDAACGIESTAGGTPPGLKSITEAYLDVNLIKYSSSSDTRYGSGGYSIQMNTNFFTGSNGHNDWVQFVYQDFVTSARFCVWNIDLTANNGKGDYYTNTVCTQYSGMTLGQGEIYTVGAFICDNTCTYVSKPGGIPVLTAWITFTTASGTSKTVWASASDAYGLANGNWLVLSGSILGASYSQINFQGNTEVQNTMAATSCSIPLAPSWTCASPQLGIAYDNTAGWVTAESNNLYYASGPNWANAPSSTLGCSNGFCWLVAYLILPQQYPNAPPQPAIIQPKQTTPPEEYQVGIPVVLQGYAKSTDPGALIGWTPCNQMTFSGQGANTFQQTPTATGNYQQNGICQAQVSFTKAGSETITLDAWNSLNQHGQAEVTINIVEKPSQPTQFDFSLTASPTASRTVQAQSVTYSITVSPKIGSPQTVTLSASGVPQSATITFSPNSGNPPYTSTLTIKTSYQTPPKTYAITVEGTGGGVTHSITLTLLVEPPPQ